MKSLLHNILLGAALLLVPLWTDAQEYAIRTYTTHQGLISNSVTAMLQDSQGYLWIGTDDGFSIFDGSTFRNCGPREKEIWGYVNAFCESSAEPGVMWIATNGGGILRHVAGTYEQWKIDSVLEANKVNDIYEERNGTLWMTTDNGFYRMKGRTATRITLPASHSMFLIQVQAMGRDILWVSSSTGIISYDVKNGRIKRILTADIGGTNGQIFPLNDTTAAVITGKGLLLLQNDRIVQSIVLPRGNYGNGTLDADRNLWIGGTECVWRLELVNGRFRFHSSMDMKNGLPVSDVSALVSDRENNLWFGTIGKGIARLQDPVNIRFRFDNLTSRGTVDQQGRIWVPSHEGMYFLKKNSDRTWNTSVQRFDKKVRPVALQIIGKNTLWATTFGEGLAEFSIIDRPDGSSFLRPVNVLEAGKDIPRIYSIVLFKDSRDHLWCSLGFQGVMIVDPKRSGRDRQIIQDFPGIPRMTIAAYAELPGGRIVAGGINSNALLEFVYEDGTYRYSGASRYDSLISPFGIRSLAATEDGSLWIGTRYDGLIRRFKDGTLKSYSSSEGPHSSQILSLYADGNALWVGTQSGLEYVPDVTSPGFILGTELTTSPVYTIGRYSGRSVWAMTGHEVTVNDPEPLTAPTPVPPVYLTQFEVNGVSQPLVPDQEYIKNDLISCSFAYTAVTLKGNSDVKYQYRLTGLHNDWQKLSPERSVTFANLSAGHYTFIVRAVLNNGRQVTDSVQQSFVIVPALWERWWFAPLILFIILFMIGGFSFLRVRQRFALEVVRVSIAADLHDDIGSVLARIANLADIMVLYASRKRSTAARSTKKKPAKRTLPEENARTIAVLSRELMEKMSDVVWSVNPDNDDPEKLTERLQTYCTELAERHQLKVNFSADGVFDRRSIDPQKTRAVLLIVKESLANILTHARAQRIDLTVEILPKRWSITVKDDGVGFNEAELPRVNGIYNMRSRAASCGGTLNVISSADQGTTIRLEMPL